MTDPDDAEGSGSPSSFDPAEFGDAFTGPSPDASEAAHSRAAAEQMLSDLALVKAGNARLEALMLDGQRTAAERDLAIAKRVIDPQDVARFAFSGARKGAEELGVRLDQDRTERRDHAGAMAEHHRRLLADSDARKAFDGRVVARARRTAGIVAAVSLLLPVAAGTGFWLGHRTGRDAGYAAARDERAAADWANTDSGRLARALDRADAGTIRRIANCTGQGWRRERKDGQRVCYGYSDGKAGAGWIRP